MFYDTTTHTHNNYHYYHYHHDYHYHYCHNYYCYYIVITMCVSDTAPSSAWLDATAAAREPVASTNILKVPINAGWWFQPL